ncbi:MAG: 16S rRNA (cytosine(1402)-N(4))-methyltransferase RsmH [Firmicutes bacterium]|nr:16S rRNA (cytosine(1402)-N(4))-methyltransferase RsmH [Bacillota bacterium]
MNEPFSHVPVLLNEVLEYLAPVSGGLYIDGTVGGGNHAAAVLASSSPGGFLLGIDRDEEALAAADARLSGYAGRYRLAHGNFSDMAEIAKEQGITHADGILLDIGVSSHQLDAGDRGFSYQQDAPLDMRMDQSCGESAADLVNSLPEKELTRILYEYGEEKWAKRIAAFIVEDRSKQPFATTTQLVGTIKKAVPRGAREKDQHPARRTFQALRIAVNGELDALKKGLENAIGLLSPGGVIVVISFHSLEDRIVKECFKLHATDCICPPHMPVCVCGHKADLKVLTKKPVTAGDTELAENRRSHSALLRAAAKL